MVSRAAGLAALAASTGCLLEPQPSHGQSSSSITYRKAFAEEHSLQGVHSFDRMLAADAAGDAIVFHISDGDFTTGPPSISAPGWTLSRYATYMNAAVYVAFAPDTNPAMFTFTSSGTDIVVLADEFAGTDPAMTFGAHKEAHGVGDCTTSLTVDHPGDVMWAACASIGSVMPAPGFEPGAAIDGNAAEWTIAATPMGTSQSFVFPNPSPTSAFEDFLITAVTIRGQ